LPEEESWDWHASTMMLAEKFKHVTTMNGEHLFPSYNTSLWQVHVPVSRLQVYWHMLTPDGITLQISKEADFICLVRDHPKISNVFECSALKPGYIYIEAGSLAYVTSVIHGMGFHQLIQQHQQQLGWLGMCALYSKNLAHLLEVNGRKQKATILFVPCMSADEEENARGKQKLGSTTDPSPSIFTPEGKRTIEHLESGQVTFNKKVFCHILLELILPLMKLWIACLSAAELEGFAQSGAIPKSHMTRVWSAISAAEDGDKQLGPNHVRRASRSEWEGFGDWWGVVKCMSLPEPGMVIDVPMASVHVHLEVSDYVQVYVGNNTGKFGGVIEVRQTSDTDFVTFMDDTSIKTGQPQQVSFWAALHDYS
jgi:hypothetical protein